jgi:hypothetical protein
MAYYSVYAGLVFEATDDGVVQKGAWFAVSMAKNPQWLAWYTYREGLPSWAQKRVDARHRAAPTHNGLEDDDFNLLGKPIAGGHPEPLDFSPQINVSEFAGDPTLGLPVQAGLQVFDHKTSYQCGINVIEGKGNGAQFLFSVTRDNDIQTFDMGVRYGRLFFQGAVSFSKHALGDGPPRRPNLSKVW